MVYVIQTFLRDCLLQCYITTIETVPTYSWTVHIVAHEFGHLFGSRHTHACVWNGNNTAIDGCWGCMENPDPNGGGCQNCPNPGVPSGGGTIMSYCHLQSVGVNFNLGFGLQPGNVIRNSVANADCLCECVSATISGPDFLCSTSSYSLQNPPTGSTVSWYVSPTNLFSGATSGTGATVNLSPASSAASGQAILTFEVTTTCGVISVDKRIWVGNATVNDITFSNSVDEFQHWCSSDDGNTFSINSLLDPDNTQWEARLLNWPSLTVAYTSPSVYTGAGPHQWFYVPPFPTQNNGYYVFQVRNINGCSPFNWIPGFEVEYVDCTIFGGDPFRIYPNPTTDYVTVSKISNQKLGEEIQRDQTSFEVSLFDVLGQEIISRTAATDEATLDLSKLKKGRYYIHIYYKEAIIRKQIKVE
ncbi:zinc-dependent metalloprotease [Belliella pelovolcani]|uniref:zinc-dependent metalloprotease n=1 Tax=Belliella pelovolcani TaxID=529505 RepID=UPI00391D574E